MFSNGFDYCHFQAASLQVMHVVISKVTEVWRMKNIKELDKSLNPANIRTPDQSLHEVGMLDR